MEIKWVLVIDFLRRYLSFDTRLSVLCLICVSWFYSPMAWAQNATMNWYFGDHAGITFLNGEPEQIFDGQINTIEGCATISRQSTGELLFYTDGVTVWNRIHEPMPNGTGLHGDESTSQSALIIPWPNNSSVFIVATPAPITSNKLDGRCFCLKYSIVDMRREDGYGDVVKRDFQLLDDVTEQVTAAPDCEGGGWWIITRIRSRSEFAAFHFTSTGVSEVPVISKVGGQFEVREAGQLHASPDGSKLVLTSSSGFSLLYQFDRSTGEVYDQVDLFDGVKIGTHYGAAFSIDGKYVYSAVSTETPVAGTTIYRWLADFSDTSIIAASKDNVAWFVGSTSWMPMQLGPDGRIYIGKPGTEYLARFNSPSTYNPVFQDNAVRLGGQCRSGLPNFPGSLLLSSKPGDSVCSLPKARLSDTAVCEAECIRFTDNSKGWINSWKWMVPGGTPAFSTDRSPRICFNQPGTYPVMLIVANPFGTDTIRRKATIYAKPLVYVAPNISICKGSSVVLRAQGAVSYSWSPSIGLSSTTFANPTASPDVTTKYTVVGTSSDGCTNSATVLVTVKSPSGGQDVSICDGGSVMLIASGADSYEWSPTDGLSNPYAEAPTASPKTTTAYVVKMRVDSCVVFDTVVVTVIDSVEVDLVAPNYSCTGSVAVLRAKGNANEYEWFGNGIILAGGDSAVVRITQPTKFTVIGKVGLCTGSDTATVFVQPGISLSVPFSNISICAGALTQLSVTTEASNITWSPPTGLDTTSGTTVVAKPAITTTYTVTALSDSGCAVSDTIRVEVKPSPSVSAGPDKQLCFGQSVRLSSNGNADEYEWRPSVGLSDFRALSPFASPGTTTTYKLYAKTADCLDVDSVTVFVSDLDLQLTQDTTICLGSSVELHATGAASYDWDPPQGLSDATIANPIASPTITTTYEVHGIDPLGCEDTKRVTVYVKDTSSVRIVVGNVSAEAGSSGVGIPVYVEIEPRLIPLHISSLKAALAVEADIFIPQSSDKGLMVPGLRDNIRRAYLSFEDLILVTPRQKITEVRGLALLGTKQSGTLTWEDVEWTDVDCPTPHSISGVISITGCGLPERAFKMFVQTQFKVLPQPIVERVDISISGGEPGVFVARLVSYSGEVVQERSVVRNLNEQADANLSFDMSEISQGLYHVVVESMLSRYAYQLAWVR